MTLRERRSAFKNSTSGWATIHPGCSANDASTCSAFERSRWRGRRFACYTPRVMPQRGVLVQRVRFRVILATAFNSVDYSQKSIEIP